MGQGHQSHQLQIHPAAPALLQFEQGAPTGFSHGATAVDVAADGTQAITPGLLQSPLAPLENVFGCARFGFLQIGRQRGSHRALTVRVGCPAERLIEMGVGIHQRGKGQRQKLTRCRTEAMDGRNRSSQHFPTIPE